MARKQNRGQDRSPATGAPEGEVWTKERLRRYIEYHMRAAIKQVYDDIVRVTLGESNVMRLYRSTTMLGRVAVGCVVSAIRKGNFNTPEPHIPRVRNYISVVERRERARKEAEERVLE